MIISVPKNLLKRIKCTTNKDSKIVHDVKKNSLVTDDPSISYNVYKGIPSMLTKNDGPKAQDWNPLEF